MSAALFFVVVLALFVLPIWLTRNRHTWRYSNPYNRTCTICGRHEVSHCWDVESWNRSWWEVFDEGNEKLHEETGS